MTERPEPATGVPRRRRTVHALLAVGAVSAWSAGALVALSTTAGAATTLGAAAAKRGRYWRNGNNTMPTATGAVG